MKGIQTRKIKAYYIILYILIITSWNIFLTPFGCSVGAGLWEDLQENAETGLHIWRSESVGPPPLSSTEPRLPGEWTHTHTHTIQLYYLLLTSGKQTNSRWDHLIHFPDLLNLMLWWVKAITNGIKLGSIFLHLWLSNRESIPFIVKLKFLTFS